MKSRQGISREPYSLFGILPIENKNMKTIKVNHSIAKKISDGSIKATWSLYDDKDLSIDDKVRIIDQVSKDPGSWRVIAEAIIDSVIFKRIGDLTSQDKIDLSEDDDFITTARKYYGPQVTDKTPVKILYFTLDKVTTSSKVTNTQHPLIQEAVLYADGGSRGNPGPSASGYAIKDLDGKIVLKKGIYLGITTNNQAEYQALKLGLEACLQMGVQRVHVYMDSLLVINQMLGIFQVKNRDLWPIHDSIKSISENFKEIHFKHVPRALNKDADSAVNEALDTQAALNRRV